MKIRVLASIIAFALASSAGFLTWFGQRENVSAAKSEPTANIVEKAQVAANFGNIPLHFEQNNGQPSGPVKFLARGAGYTLFLTSHEAVLQLRNASARRASANPHSAIQTPHLLRMRFAGATESAEVTGEDELAGKTNYFIGNDPTNWRANISNFARVRYHEIYPGVDVVYYGNQQQLEYDFVISPAADPRGIALEFNGAQKIKVDAQGELILRTKGGEVRQQKPKVYQEIAGERRTIAGRYVVKGKNRMGLQWRNMTAPVRS